MLLIVVAILMLPIFRPGFLVTDDGDWMVVRLSAFYQSFREGQFPVRFLGRLNQSQGYPVANFLYPGFMYVGSILHAIGLSFQTSVEVIVVGSVIVGSVGMYFWLKRIFGGLAGLTGGLAYALMPYLMFDIFKRGSVGEVLVLGCMPILFWAIETKNKWIVALMVAFVTISHNTLAALFLPIVFLFMILKKYWPGILYFLLGVGMASFFWFPAFFERAYVMFNSEVISDPNAYFSVSRTITMQSFPILVSILILLWKGIEKKQKEFLFFCACLGAGLFFASKMSAALWQLPAFVKYIQFPFRWLALFVLFGPWVIAFAANRLGKKNILMLICIGLVFGGVWLTSYMRSESVVRPEGYFTTNEATTTVQNEYMPRWAKKSRSERANKRIEFFTGKGKIEEVHSTTKRLEAVIDAEEQSVIQINTVFYPGWGALLDGQKVDMRYENEYGLMRIDIPAGTHQLFVEFRETGARFIADILSALFFIVFCVSFVVTAIMKQQRRVRKK